MSSQCAFIVRWMMEIVIFRDLLEDDSEPFYGVLEDCDEPSVICLECGSTFEFGDYEILKKISWRDFNELLTKKQKYAVCMNASYVRDAQMLDTSELSDEQFSNIDFMSSDVDELWHDMEPNPFIAIIEAESEEEACEKVAKQNRYDSRCLYAIKI